MREVFFFPLSRSPRTQCLVEFHPNETHNIFFPIGALLGVGSFWLSCKASGQDMQGDKPMYKVGNKRCNHILKSSTILG
jgi:hypothetical protein